MDCHLYDTLMDFDKKAGEIIRLSNYWNTKILRLFGTFN